MKQIEIPMPVSAQVANAIRDEILNGNFIGGQKISVQKISDMLAVSATPVKEAFKILQVEGLLKTIPRSGTVISDFAKQNLQNTAYIRSALEGVAVQLATKVASADELLAIGKILDQSDVAINNNDVDALVSINTAFHHAIRLASHNQYLITLIDQLVSFDYTIRKNALAEMKSRVEGMQEHKQILLYMKNRDADSAEKAMIHHIRKTVDIVVQSKKREGDHS